MCIVIELREAAYQQCGLRNFDVLEEARKRFLNPKVVSNRWLLLRQYRIRPENPLEESYIRHLRIYVELRRRYDRSRRMNHVTGSGGFLVHEEMTYHRKWMSDIEKGMAFHPEVPIVNFSVMQKSFKGENLISQS